MTREVYVLVFDLIKLVAADINLVVPHSHTPPLNTTLPPFFQSCTASLISTIPTLPYLPPHRVLPRRSIMNEFHSIFELLLKISFQPCLLYAICVQFPIFYNVDNGFQLRLVLKTMDGLRHYDYTWCGRITSGFSIMPFLNLSPYLLA
jgi:hypothetical protein